MGINRLTGRVIILPEARFDYTSDQILKFVKMWEEGEPISRIAEYFAVSKHEASLLVMHCEIEELIGPRKGGLLGTKKHKWKRKKEVIQID